MAMDRPHAATLRAGGLRDAAGALSRWNNFH